MKILQLVTIRQYRGAEVFAANLSEQLVHHGHKVLFVGLFPVAINPLEVNGAANLDLNGNAAHFLDLRLLKSLIKLVKTENPEIIQANGSDTLKYAVLASFFVPKRPIIYRNISIISTWIGKSFLKKLFYKLLFSRVSHVSSVGKDSIEDFIKCLNYPKSRTSVIRRGIPFNTIDALLAKDSIRKEFHLNGDERILIHVGSFSNEKNQSFLINAINLLKDKFSNFKLILVGDGKTFEHVKALVSKLDLNKYVIFTGFRNDVSSLIASSDLLLLCSTVEGVPGVVMEAGVQIVPTLAVNVGGVKEVVIDGQTGWLFPNHDVELFSKKLYSLLKSDMNVLLNAGERAYELAQNEFSVDKTYQSFINLYNNLLAEL